jgi:hypothetical protein
MDVKAYIRDILSQAITPIIIAVPRPLLHHSRHPSPHHSPISAILHVAGWLALSGLQVPLRGMSNINLLYSRHL